MASRSPIPSCDFCGHSYDAAELLFRSDIGGMPPWICSTCVDGYAAVIRVHRDSPALADALVTAHNAGVKHSRSAAR